jgi:hypothetical protein
MDGSEDWVNSNVSEYFVSPYSAGAAVEPSARGVVVEVAARVVAIISSAFALRLSSIGICLYFAAAEKLLACTSPHSTGSH